MEPVEKDNRFLRYGYGKMTNFYSLSHVMERDSWRESLE